MLGAAVQQLVIDFTPYLIFTPIWFDKMYLRQKQVPGLNTDSCAERGL